MKDVLASVAVAVLESLGPVLKVLDCHSERSRLPLRGT